MTLPGGIPGLLEFEWDTATGRGWYRILAGTPPAVAWVNGDRLEQGNLTQAEFTAVCRRWMLG